MNVFVIGNSGAGKTTHAKRLAEELGFVHFDLDPVAFVDQAGTRRDVLESVTLIAQELAGREAVLDGCYADIVDVMSTEEDTLIWIDTPVELCVERARVRGHEAHKWPSKTAQDEFLPRLIDFIRAYPTRDDPTGKAAHERIFAGFPGVKQRLD